MQRAFAEGLRRHKSRSADSPEVPPADRAWTRSLFFGTLLDPGM
jgi:hypothetical protein